MKLKILFLGISLLLTSISGAATAPTLAVSNISNASSLDSTATLNLVKAIHDRLQTNNGWKVLDTILANGEREAQIATAQGVKASYLLRGYVEAGSQIGKSRLVITLVDADDGRDLQTEDMELGANPDSELGRIATFVKLFDPASLAIDNPEVKKDKLNDDVSTSASWVLGGTAIMVLLVVIYSLTN